MVLKYFVKLLIIPIIIFLLLCSSPILATKAFAPHTFPDSLREWTECGLVHPALVCDPDALLNAHNDSNSGESALDLLDAATQHIQLNTECICDKVGPEGKSFAYGGICPKNAPVGFVVTVAVLGKMEVTDEQRKRYRSGAHLPAIFANELRSRLQRGQCADDVLIVLAVNDSSIIVIGIIDNFLPIRTSTGGWAATKLDAQFILNVSQTARRFFYRNDYTGGLLYMLDEYGRRLGAPPVPEEMISRRKKTRGRSWWDTNFWPIFPEALRQSEIRWFWLLFLLLLLLALIFVTIFLVIRLQQRKRTLGYQRGQPTPDNGTK